MSIDSEEDPGGARQARGAAGEGIEDVVTDPGRLEKHGNQLTGLGDRLHERARRTAVQPLRLGTAPPALWFAERLARLAGPDGTPGVLGAWATGLTQVGAAEGASARTYRTTDDDQATTYTGLGAALDEGP